MGPFSPFAFAPFEVGMKLVQPAPIRSVKRITIGGKALAFPWRLQWRIREQPLSLWLGALTYTLILLVGVLSSRRSHVSRATAK